jgi:3-phenylpropionate/trans-cinnamate dioxygenase ferredoxin subunit
MSTAIAIGRADDIAPGTALRVEIDGRQVAIVRIGDDFYAIGDTCTHADYSLAEGEIDPDERAIECWKHGALFSLETGEALTLPATRATPVYDVVVDDDGALKVVISDE